MSQQRKHAQVSQTTKVVLNSTVANSFLFAALVDFVEACREQGVDANHYVSCGASGLTWAREVRARLTKPICAHCGRPCGDEKAGRARIEDVSVCDPTVTGRPGCYVLVTEFRHQLRNCPICSWRDGYVKDVRMEGPRPPHVPRPHRGVQRSAKSS